MTRLTAWFAAVGLAAAVAYAGNAPEARAQRADAASKTAPIEDELHRQAAEELEKLARSLSPELGRKIVGVYVAFDPSATDIRVMAACDDDGDYTVVVTEGLLLVLDVVAKAKATDEIFGTHKVDEYASLFARAPAGARIPPPPAGFFDRTQAIQTEKLVLERARLREALAGVLAHEVAHMTLGDLVCPSPTATHERADDVWTPDEQREALADAPHIYTPGRLAAATTTGTTNLLDAGRTEEGLVALLGFFDRIERAGNASAYTRIHGASDIELRAVRAAAADWRRTHAKGPKEKG